MGGRRIDRTFAIKVKKGEGGRVKWAIVRSLKYESVNDDARIEGDRLSTKLGN